METRQTRRFSRQLATITLAILLLLSGLAAAQVAPVELAPVERRAIVETLRHPVAGIHFAADQPTLEVGRQAGRIG